MRKIDWALGVWGLRRGGAGIGWACPVWVGVEALLVAQRLVARCLAAQAESAREIA